METVGRVEIIDRKPFTLEQLKTLISNFRESHKGVDAVEKSPQVQLFAEQLIQESQRFEHVFKTSHGSYYFVLNSGESFRIKCHRNVNGEKFHSKYRGQIFEEIYTIEPIAQQIFFYDDSTLKYDDDPDGIIGISFAELPFALETRPLEIQCIDGQSAAHQELHVERRDNLTSCKPADLASGHRLDFHRGHPVSEITK